MFLTGLNFSAGCGGNKSFPNFVGPGTHSKRWRVFWKQNNQLRFLTKLSTDFQFISHPTKLLNYLGHFDTCLLNNLFIFEDFIVDKWYILKYYIRFFISLEKKNFWFFFFLDHLNISGNNIIRVKLAQILQYSNTPYYLEHPHQCLVCDPAKIFLTSKFVYLLFCNPTHKTEIANRWELLRTNYLNQSLCLAKLKIGSKSGQIIFITLFSNRYIAVLSLLPTSANWAYTIVPLPFWHKLNYYFCFIELLKNCSFAWKFH